ncbi:MAG: alpha/beta hydrolase [Beijerinckiaceae bacterium]
MTKNLRFCLALMASMITMDAKAQSTDKPVAELGGYAVLTMPKGKPRGSVILMPGGDGSLGITSEGAITKLNGNQLVRTRSNYAAAGFATLTLDSWGSPSAAVKHMQTIAKPVVVVATSRGATRLHSSLSAAPDGIVITSGMLDQFQANVGSAASLPRTLVIHHRQDGCRVTLPSLVDPFIAWSAGRARAVWLDGGRDQGDPCQAAGYHGFAGLDGQVVSRVTGFTSSLR